MKRSSDKNILNISSSFLWIVMKIKIDIPLKQIVTMRRTWMRINNNKVVIIAIYHHSL